MARKKTFADPSSGEAYEQSLDCKYKPEQPLPHSKDFRSHLILQGTHDLTFLDQEGSMYFDSYEASLTAMHGAQWYSPQNDWTIPLVPKHERMYVRRIFSSFLTTELANDSERSQYIGRFRANDQGFVFYPYWAIEKCAWNIVHEVKKIHLHGFRYDKIFDVEILKHIETTKNFSFEERISFICRILENSKNVAVNLLKDEKLMTSIAAPWKLYNSSITNNGSNKNRNYWVKIGRAQDPNHTARVIKRRRTSESPDAVIVGDDRATLSPEADYGRMKDAAQAYYTSHATFNQHNPGLPSSNSVDIAMPDHEAIHSPDEDKYNKTTTENDQEWHKSEIPDTSALGRAQFGLQTLPRLPSHVHTASSASASAPASAFSAAPRTWTLAARSPQSPRIPPNSPPDNNSTVHDANLEETAQAADAMLLLRSSSHLPAFNRRA